MLPHFKLLTRFKAVKWKQHKGGEGWQLVQYELAGVTNWQGMVEAGYRGVVRRELQGLIVATVVRISSGNWKNLKEISVEEIRKYIEICIWHIEKISDIPKTCLKFKQTANPNWNLFIYYTVIL